MVSGKPLVSFIGDGLVPCLTERVLRYPGAASASTTSCDALASRSGRVHHPVGSGIRKCKATPSLDPAVTRDAQPCTCGPHSEHLPPIREHAAEPGYGAVRGRHGRLSGICAQHEHCGVETQCGVCWSSAAGAGKGQWELGRDMGGARYVVPPQRLFRTVIRR